MQPTWRKRWSALWTLKQMTYRTYRSCTEIRTSTPISSKTIHLRANFRYTWTGFTSRATATFIPCRLTTRRREFTSATTWSRGSVTAYLFTTTSLIPTTSTLCRILSRLLQLITEQTSTVSNSFSAHDSICLARCTCMLSPVRLSVTLVDQSKTVEVRLCNFHHPVVTTPLVLRGKFHPESWVPPQRGVKQGRGGGEWVIF